MGTLWSKKWAGSVLLGIASLHLVFTLALGAGLVSEPQLAGKPPLLRMTPGFGSAQPYDLLALTVFWSLFFGLTLAILAVLIRALEKRDVAIPRAVGGLLLAMCATGAVLVPAGGFWLALLPAARLTTG